jgi:hypothetical protein
MVGPVRIALFWRISQMQMSIRNKINFKRRFDLFEMFAFDNYLYSNGNRFLSRIYDDG